MKKLIVFGTALVLAACGTEKTGEPGSETPNDGTSSVVETTNPEGTTSPTNNNTTSVPEGELTSVEFFEMKHDFGNVFYPSENKHTFKFKNTGGVPLIIKEATASCGCTVPNKPEKPIAPGEVGELDVIFRPKEGQVGQPVSKTITVVANTNPEQTLLEISANVLKGL